MRESEEQKKAWEMYTPTWEMDGRVHSGGTWKQIGIGGEIDARQRFLEEHVACTAEMGRYGWKGTVGGFMKNSSDELFFIFLANRASQIYWRYTMRCLQSS